MGLLRKASELHRRVRRVLSPLSGVSPAAGSTRWRACRFEQMEPRQLLSASPAEIHVGAVYYEDDGGEDQGVDQIEITWNGGAPGTTLTQLLIKTDKNLDGAYANGDVFFDTAPGGMGVYGSAPLSIVERTGIDQVGATVADGGMLLVLSFVGFDPDEKLVFTIDVDEQGDDLAGTLPPEQAANPVAEGREFQGSRLEATFAAPHYHQAAGWDFFVDEYDDSKLQEFKLGLPPDKYVPPGDTPHQVRTAGAIFSLEQTPLPISIAGTVFEDLDLDNVRAASEPALASVKLALFRLEGGRYVTTGQTAVTNAKGEYRFEDVLPGTYRIVETQPAGYYSVGAREGTVDGLPRGHVTSVDVISGIGLLGGEKSVDNDFAEARPATLSGHVYHDASNDGRFDAQEKGIGGVLVRVQCLPPTGPAPAPIEVSTAADGSWSVKGLMPGDYRVEEVQPGGYLDGLDAPGTAGGVAHNPGDRIDGIRLVSGASGREYNFGELVPGSISGRVIADANGNCAYDPGEALLANVTVHLLDASGHRVATKQTGTDGRYAFTGLAPGVYGVEEIQPAGYYDGGDHVGTAGGVLLPPDSIVQITLVSGTAAVGYDFCELLPSSISGRVSVDANGNGAYDPGEALLAKVTVHLLDASGHRIATAQTGTNGRYSFKGLAPGVYGVEEIQPKGYFDGSEQVGSEGGKLRPPDSIVGIKLVSGTAATEYNFCELEPVSLSGFVYVDQNNNAVRDAGEAPIAGVELALLDGQGAAKGITTTSDGSGFYRFQGLQPGQVYGVAETQPAGFFDGSDSAGTAGGVAHNPGDRITDVLLPSGTDAENYNFGELEPVSLSGFVYVDQNNNAVRDAGEAPIAGVELALLDGQGAAKGITTTSDGSGFYRFQGLQPGQVYGVAETQPAGFFDGSDSAGTAGGVAHNPGDRITDVLLPPGTDAENYNFGEFRPASIGGRVCADLNTNGNVDPGEPLLAGVTIHLLDVWGNRIATRTTDQQGEYVFRNLAPGTYGVEEIQPDGYFDGDEHVGTAGGKRDGNDRIAGAKLISGFEAVEYDFCELVPGSISGYVFQDGPTIRVPPLADPPDPADVRDGQRTADDRPLGGVVLRLGDATGQPVLDAHGRPMTAVTDARGFYEFTGLRPGVYTVFEVQPGGYVDGIDTPGSHGGTAVNPHEPVDPVILGRLTVDPRNDAILGIQINSGDTAESYNFSEVLVIKLPFIPPPPPPPPPPPSPPSPPSADPSPTPIPAVRYIPSPGIELLPMYGGGSERLVAYTWHLSVVNGGWPRRESDGTHVTAGQNSPYFNPVSWTGTDMSRSQWVLADDQGQPVRQLQFGVEGGIPVTGDFNGDGITEVAIFLNGIWFIDLNGNGIWDEGDLWARLGTVTDLPVAGDWDGDGKTDIGIFGPAWAGDARAIAAEAGLPDVANDRPPTARYKNLPPDPGQAPVGQRTMKRTAQGRLRADLIDHVFQYGLAGDVPVVGDWNGDGVTNIGLYREGTWYLDADGDGQWSAADVYVSGIGGPGDRPVVGDFNGDGIDDLGVYRDGTWRLDTDGDRVWTASDRVFELGGPDDRPVVGDFNGDGVDEAGIYRDGVTTPDQEALQPGNAPTADVAARQ